MIPHTTQRKAGAASAGTALCGSPAPAGRPALQLRPCKPVLTYHAHAPLTVKRDQRGVVEMPIRQARRATFKVQVNFVGYGIEDRRSCHAANILNKEKADDVSGR